MSRRGERNRQAVLEAAAKLLRKHGAARVTMGDVAAAAGLSRQSVYAHFPSRTRLLVALLEHIGTVEGREQRFRPAREAPTGRKALEAAVMAATEYNAQIHDVALAFDLARHGDPAAATAWRHKMAERRGHIARRVRRLARENALHADWTERRATDAVDVLASPRLYEDLVVERGWPLRDYQRLVRAAISVLLR
jgi:AcrR family transcriptional regulator